MRKPFSISAAALAILISPGSPQFVGTADAGGYVALVLDFAPVAAPVPAPAAFTLCGEPTICVGLALAMLAFMVQSGGDGSGDGAEPLFPPTPPLPPPIPSVEPPMPPEIPAVPLPATGPLLLGGLAVTALIRRRRSKRLQG